MTETSKLVNAMSELVTWVEGHEGDVDRTAFRAACAGAALLAARLPTPECPHGARVPYGLDGLTGLDFADCRIGTYYAIRLAARFPRLPGAEAFR